MASILNQSGGDISKPLTNQGLSQVGESGKPNRVACSLNLVKRLRTPGSSIIRFITTSDLAYPGFLGLQLNPLLGKPSLSLNVINRLDEC